MGFEFYEERDFKETELGLLPQDWQVVRLGEVLEPERKKISWRNYDGKIPIVEKITFDTGKIVLRNKNKTRTDLYISTNNTSFITSKINFHQGAIAIVEKILAATTHYEFYKLKKQTDVNYLWRFFRSNFFKEIFQNEIRYYGFKKEANYNFIKNLKIPLPPLEEQHEIVRRVEKLFALADSIEEKYKKAYECIEKLEHAILAKAFSVELVDPDPNDEPAEKFLKGS